MQERSLLSTPFPAFIVCRLFDDGHSDQCEIIAHCSFDLYFSNDVEHIFMCMSSVEKYLFRSFSHFLFGLFVFLALSCHELLVYFGN